MEGRAGRTERGDAPVRTADALPLGNMRTPHDKPLKPCAGKGLQAKHEYVRL